LSCFEVFLKKKKFKERKRKSEKEKETKESLLFFLSLLLSFFL